MKKLLLILLIFSCSDAEIIQNCDCGIIEALGQSGICYYVGVTNECTNNYKNLCFDTQEERDFYIVGLRQCNDKFNF